MFVVFNLVIKSVLFIKLSFTREQSYSHIFFCPINYSAPSQLSVSFKIRQTLLQAKNLFEERS